MGFRRCRGAPAEGGAPRHARLRALLEAAYQQDNPKLVALRMHATRCTKRRKDATGRAKGLRTLLIHHRA